MASPGRSHAGHHLRLLLPDTLEELEHAERTVWSTIVWPRGELEVTNIPEDERLIKLIQ